MVPAFDLAVGKMKKPFNINGLTTGYKLSIFAGQDSDLANLTLDFYGYGNECYLDPKLPGTGQGSGVLRSALAMPVHSVGGGEIILWPNNQMQVTTKGDSGGAIFLC